MIFDYCSSVKNDTSLGNFVIAKGKYLLLRIKTFSDRKISTTFDMFLFDDSNLATVSPNPPVFMLTHPSEPLTTTLSPNRGSLKLNIEILQTFIELIKLKFRYLSTKFCRVN